MEQDKKENNQNIDSTNIFDEFSQDEKLKSQIKDIESQKRKDVYHYLGTLSNFLKTLNIFLLFIFLLFVGYSYVQNDATLQQKSYLNPFCKVLLISSQNGVNCSSASSMVSQYSKKNSKMEEDYYTKITSMLGDVYKLSNFTSSKEILFLLDKSQNRLLPLKILEEFDELKNKFEPTDKTRIMCDNISISGDWMVSLRCNAFSSAWDSQIVGASAKDSRDTVGGTSISWASSFINYLEKKGTTFIVTTKPKTFTSVDYIGNPGYSKKTEFNLVLQSKGHNISLLK